MITLNNITKSYKTTHGKHYVFRNISMVFPEGKNIGILGPNGAGKSTFLRLVGKIDFPDEGQVVTSKRISWPVGLSGGFQGSLTGRDNVKFICRIYGIKGEEMEERISFVRDFADIGKFFDLPVKTYSTGMRARVNFGVSMALDFDYYLVDELTAVGDQDFRIKSQAMFKDKVKKANLIMVSHQMPILQANCEAGVLIRKGEIEYFDDIRDAIKAYTKG